jgi:hypothetical protein
MHRLVFRLIGLCLVLGVLAALPGKTPRAGGPQASRDQNTRELWSQVERAEREGLPRTAVNLLKKIVSLSREGRRTAEFLRALTRQLILESVVQGNKPEYRVDRMEAELASAPAAARPMMELILAQWYRHYYARNRWRFMNRTATQGLDEKDFTTWDLPRLFRRIDSLYRGVLAGADRLKKIPLADFSGFLLQGNLPPALRPTLFDFAAFEALDFYTSGEQAAARPEDAFEIKAESPALGPASEFLDYRPETTDVDSPKLQALKLYQEVLAFHRSEGNREAFLDADLNRLRYVRNVAVGEGASGRYAKRLEEITTQAPDSDLQSLAFYYWADEISDRGDLVLAYEIAGRGEQAHPQSIGAADCRTLRGRLTAKEFSLRAESVIRPEGGGRMSVDYRNVTALHFRAVREDFASLLGGPEARSLFWMSDETVERVIARPAQAQWSVKLEPTSDYRTRTAVVDVPPLPPGFYRIVAGCREDFAREANKIQAVQVWSSPLGLVMTGTEGAVRGFVVQNGPGNPVRGAEVTLYRWDYNSRSAVKAESVTTDELGSFVFARPQSAYSRLVHIQGPGGPELAETNVPESYPSGERPSTRTLFFTDRSLYRPGQMIEFKGICLSINQERNDYDLLTGRPVRVTLRDPNRQPVAALDLRTNDFGSFSGTFTAPTDRLTGALTISTDNPSGSATVRVEEYKRPKFQVQLDVPDKEYRLNDRVSLSGQATAYTGAPVDGALVKYRVTRRVRYPWWWSFWYSVGSGQSQEIDHGTLSTDENGKFRVEFTARPDASVSAASNPIFTFAVSADVTDSAGETRSAGGTVRLGYSALQAGLSCADWQEAGRPVVIDVTTTTLNDVRVAARGRVEVVGLRGPEKPVADDLLAAGEPARRAGAPAGSKESSDWRRWPEGRAVAGQDFETTARPGEACRLSFNLKPGPYKARLTTRDKFGTPVEAFLYIMVLDTSARSFPVPIPFTAVARAARVEVGGTFEALWGTGYGQGPVLVEMYQSNRVLRRSWAPAAQTQGLIRLPVEENLRGGFTIILTMVKENRLYRREMRVAVPWSNKVLDLSWQTFRSKLRPGQKETWSLKVSGPDAAARAAEMVATLYDASLDQFYGHGFPDFRGIFRTDRTSIPASYSNRALPLGTYSDTLNPHLSFPSREYPHFPRDILDNSYGYRFATKMGAADRAVPAPTAAREEMKAEGAVEGPVVGGVVGGVLGGVTGEAEAPAGPGPDLSQVQARRNLNETAFFYPHLLTGKDGLVTLEFEMPEALTEWRFLGFAHTRDLESGSIEDRAVTQKELMIQPNPPRFLREGDRLEFTAKVTNMTDAEARGAVELTFFDPRTEKPLDASLANTATRKSFVVPARQSRSFSWPVTVADRLEVVGYKAVAATDKFSDGEEGILPVLSRRVFVQESIPLWITGPGEKKFAFRKLLDSGGSPSLESLGLTVQMASNPAWYAVQALPFLMEFPYECSEQVFNRLYADGLAHKIANSDPKIRRIFDLWKGTAALQSNLEKNQELKDVLLQESPWVLQAQAESQAKRNIGLLFDENRVSRELRSALGKLAAMQLDDGSWPWFPGGRGNEYITLYIVTGFGRLKHLGVESVPQDMALKALGRLDAWLDEIYRSILESGTAGHNHLSPTIALFLYGRSFYLPAKPIPDSSREAVDYFLKQAARYWLQLDYRQSQAHLALALNRFGDRVTARKIMRSMKERSQVDEELGRFWSELELGWWWYRAPIETQAVMIEAFDEVMNDQQAVEECKVWLLKQKQTQDWKTTKATADAVYALILRGADLLASNEIVRVALGGRAVEPKAVEAGTGFYEERFGPKEIAPAMGNVVVTKSDPGIAWGGVHWQYLDDISRITPHTQNPLRLKKSVFLRQLTKSGPVIEPVKGPVEVGDTLVVRIELRTDRDMEYVHMRDYRGSGLEPTNVLSQYKYQDGLAYYESTKDTATHFFIDYLPKGTYVFEYELRVQLRGSYQNGIALIECMYAPEFNSHSESVELKVK